MGGCLFRFSFILLATSSPYAPCNDVNEVANGGEAEMGTVDKTVHIGNNTHGGTKRACFCFSHVNTIISENSDKNRPGHKEGIVTRG